MFKIYSSSAGSGKTYTLTKEYIKLALNPGNDSYYRHILAVTFTNAAAQEMKDRILSTLKAFTLGSSHPMINDIVSELFPETNNNPLLKAEKLAELQKQSARIFTRILHGYSDFSVMTIDSFMSRLVGSFTDELGLPFGFETRLDGDLLSGAIEQLLSRIGLTGEESLSSLLETYYLTHAKEEGAWGALPRQMLNAAGDLLNEQSYLAMSKVTHLTLEDWQYVRKELLSFIRNKEDEIVQLAGKASQTIAANGLSASDFFQSTRGIFGYFSGRSQAGSAKLWEAPNSYVTKTIGEDKWQAGKLTQSAAAAIQSLSPLLTDIFQQIEAIRTEYGGRTVLYKSIVGQLYNLSLLNEIKREFDLLLRQNNQVHISEFNRRIIQIVANDPVPFIFERLGEKYNHILIDEFQDTSKLQFANLLPLIDNALANGYFNLVVGDMKQAIYRFRGGDMELLLNLSSRQAHEISGMFEHGDNGFLTDQLWQLDQNTDLDRLVTNRRSFKEITSFNNAFFSHLSRTDNSGTQLTTEVYDQYFQQETGPFTPSGGHVEINFFDPKEEAATDLSGEDAILADEPGQEAADQQGKRVITLLGQLHEEGYYWRDIAILCRYKKDAAQLALWLGDLGIPLISDDSLLLSNSRQIAFIIHFIKVVHNPGNVNQRLETALLFQNLILGRTVSGTEMDAIVAMSKEPGLDSFLSYLATLNVSFDAAEIYQMGIYELCEQIVARFGLSNSATAESQYLFRFLDEVLQFETTRVSHPGDFLNWWITTGQSVSISASEDSDAVRITTIHKSKGLEYPVVICPYADWKATPKPGSRLWIDLHSFEYPEFHNEERALPATAVPLTKSLADTPVNNQYQNEVERVLLENINLTYVAFTRAVQRLYILADLATFPKDPVASPLPSVNAWLQSYLREIGEWDNEKRQYTIHQGNNIPTHTGNSSESRPFVLIPPSMSKKRAAILSIRKNADKVFNTETFQPEHSPDQKLRQILIQAGSSGNFREIVQRNIQTGLLRVENLSAIHDKIERLSTLPAFREVFDPSATPINHQFILKGGEILEADRIVRTTNGHFFVVLFAATPPSQALKNQMTRLLKAGKESGMQEVDGILIDLKSETIEMTKSGKIAG